MCKASLQLLLLACTTKNTIDANNYTYCHEDHFKAKSRDGETTLKSQDSTRRVAPNISPKVLLVLGEVVQVVNDRIFLRQHMATNQP